MPAPASHRTKLIRATALCIVGRMRKPATTNEVISAVVRHIEEWPVPEIGVFDRHEIRLALEALAREDKLVRHASGEVEPARVRRSGRRVQRARRGTVSWSMPGIAAEHAQETR